MKNFEKETIQAQLTDEQKALQDLQKAYKQAKKDCQEKIRLLNARKDMQNLQSIVHQKKYQQALMKQIDGVLNDLQTHTYKTANEFFQGSYQNGYIGSMYELQKQGIPITVPVSTKKMIRAIQTDSKLSQGYYLKQGLSVQNIRTLKKQIALETTRGIASGKSWLEVAESLSIQRYFQISESDAMRICRTEGNRINQQARLDAGDEAVKSGCDLLKQWDATLDGVTRPAHREADGQIVEWDEDFIVMGEKLPAPSIGGSASNVINCRCQLLKRPRWSLDEEELETLKKRAEFYGLDKSKSFEDYKQKFLQIPDNPVVPTIESVEKQIKDAETKLNDLKKQRNDTDLEIKRKESLISSGEKKYYSKFDEFDTEEDVIKRKKFLQGEIDDYEKQKEDWLIQNPKPEREFFHLDDEGLSDEMYDEYYQMYRDARHKWVADKNEVYRLIDDQIWKRQSEIFDLDDAIGAWGNIKDYRKANSIGLDVLKTQKSDLQKKYNQILSDIILQENDIDKLNELLKKLKYKTAIEAGKAKGSFDIRQTTTKLKKAMKQEDYDEFISVVEKNPDVAPLFEHADELRSVKYVEGGGVVKYGTDLEFSYPDQMWIDDGMSKWETVAHEHGHFFDRLDYGELTWKEYKGVRDAMNSPLVKGELKASASDQFLSAMRKDAETIFSKLPEIKKYCLKHMGITAGVQDAIDGLGFGRIAWGHGDAYYNRFYNKRIKSKWIDHSKDVQAFYKSLGFDVSSQLKVKKLARHYDTSSELWANITASVTCGGEGLEEMKKYFPESTKVFLEITKRLV